MMLQKIAGSSQTIRAPKGLLRAGAPSPRRQMTSKMAPAQQSSSLSVFFSSSPTDFVFFSPSFFCFGTSCRATFEGGVFFFFFFGGGGVFWVFFPVFAPSFFFFLGGGGLLESFVLFVRRCSIRVCVHIDLITQLRY